MTDALNIKDTFATKCAEMVAYRVKTYPLEITLPLGASAEPGHCGTCKFFRREVDQPYNAMDGTCEIRMPPFKKYFAEKVRPIEEEEWYGPNHIKDTFGCDLYQTDGRIYIVQRRVPPEKNG